MLSSFTWHVVEKHVSYGRPHTPDTMPPVRMLLSLNTRTDNLSGWKVTVTGHSRVVGRSQSWVKDARELTSQPFT